MSARLLPPTVRAFSQRGGREFEPPAVHQQIPQLIQQERPEIATKRSRLSKAP